MEIEPEIGGALIWRQDTLSFHDRPPYRPLLMDDVRATPWNGLRAVSTFSGAGGSCLGLRLAGFRVLWASEFVQAARETYQANFPDVPVDSRDIRQVAPAEIVAATGVPVGQLDLLEGSPPCAAFSTSGRREAVWGQIRKYSDTQQRVDDLFFEFARLLGGLMPRAFVAENVVGLTIGRAKDIFRQILAALVDCGYRVSARVLDASWFGVPQARRRVFYVGFREDLGISPGLPDPLPYRYGVEDACPWLAAPNAPCPLALDDPQDVGGDLSRYAVGRAATALRPGDESDRYFSLQRLRVRGPGQTILASHGDAGIAGIIAPWETRQLHIPEVKRLCGFPDDFVLTGTFEQRWERMGRAVPPQLMAAVAGAIAWQLGERK